MELSQLKIKFNELFPADTTTDINSFFCPGRVNLIGEHIDYNGGYVFPAALTIGITALWRAREDRKIVMQSLNAKGEIVVDIDSQIDYNSVDSWGNYPKGMMQFLKQQGIKLKGGNILFYSNLPDGAGLSSSAAIEVLTGYMLLHLANENIDRVALARWAQSVENNYIGVNCGIMDQFAVANGKKNHAILLDCQSLKFEYAPINLQDYSLVIMNTNKRRELAESKYNERRAECDKALALLNQKYRYTNLCEASQESINELITDPIIAKRALHVVSENERVKKSVEVLNQGDLIYFGKLINASHDSLKYDYEVTGKELDCIVEEARKISSCIGARMTGAGFGGCAIAIVQTKQIDEFKMTVSKNYEAGTGLKPTFYTSTIGNGVELI
jgi:galactokinase